MIKWITKNPLASKGNVSDMGAGFRAEAAVA
jgi:hypothetical protein